MKREEILKIIEGLSHSQGLYGRILRDLKDLEQENPEEYEECMQTLEAQNFKEPLDLIRYIEE